MSQQGERWHEPAGREMAKSLLRSPRGGLSSELLSLTASGPSSGASGSRACWPLAALPSMFDLLVLPVPLTAVLFLKFLQLNHLTVTFCFLPGV